MHRTMHISMSLVAFLGPQNTPKSSAAGTSPQTPLGSLQRSSDFLAGFKKSTSKAFTSKGRREDGTGGKERGGRQKTSLRHCTAL